MKILSIETSCDETAAAVIEDGRRILSSVIHTQVEEHKLYGGVVPEIASRRHTESICGVTAAALEQAGLTVGETDAVAVTAAPGLIGAVLVGVNFAKSAALALGVPLIPVHHIRGHVAANYLAFPELKPPFLALVVSGGHSLILDVADYTQLHILGSTRDDAAGECFDKVARVLGMPYPGGKALDAQARQGDCRRYPIPRSHVEGAPLDMSFSGLKTAALNTIHNAQQKGEALSVPDLCASFEAAVADTLAPRVELALRQTGHRQLVIAGGVAANTRIRAELTAVAQRCGAALYAPPLSLCGDNGAMIGAQGYYEFLAGHTAGAGLNAYATMPCDHVRW